MSQTQIGTKLGGIPPATSYWIGANRDELAQQIAAQRHRQATPTVNDVKHDPALEATAEWMTRRALLRARKGLR